MFALADDWFRWRGPNLNGVSEEQAWQCDWSSAANIVWRAEVGTGFSSFVTCQNRCITVGHTNDQAVVRCFDVDSGKEQWSFAYAASLDDRDFEGGTTGTPTIDDGRVYTLSRSGQLFCLELDTGKQRWSIQAADVAGARLPGWGFAAAPLVVGSKILLNIGEHGAAFDKSDGRMLWHSADREAGYGTPVYYPQGDRLIAIFASARAYIGVDVETGQAIWTERWLTTFGCNAADAIVTKEQFLLSSGYNRGAALFQLENGQPKLQWKNKDLQNQLHASIKYGDFLYGIDGDMERGAQLKCLNWATGETKWTTESLRPGGLTLAGGRLIVLSDDGELVVATASSAGFEEIARARVLDDKCWTAPVISGGRIFCRSVSGQVACVDVRR